MLTLSDLFKIQGLVTVLLFTLIFSCGTEKPQEIVEVESQIPDRIDYNLHVKPILSDRCFACHGPDPNTREAGLRLDEPYGVLGQKAEAGTRFIIQPGKLVKSEVFHRIVSEDPELRMPPPSSHLELTAEEKAILIRWIEQGAEYKPHWSFIKPVKADLPSIKHVTWVRNEIDQFIGEKLENLGVSPSEEAEKEVLIRRVSLDLTGLPPDRELVDQFMADVSPNAYEKVVDVLLASPSFGERMALDWLDIARYADSNGMHADGYRMMWPWRDWVIKSFNANMPYDQFITWQVAGDLLPSATKEQILATAFNRNNITNSEAGIIDEEFRQEYVMERSETIATGLLGLSLSCARCHDHKYDPLTQKDYFSMASFFNKMDELGMTGVDGNTGPLLLYLDEEEEAKLETIKNRIHQWEIKLEEAYNENIAEEKLDRIKKDLAPMKTRDLGLLAYLSFDKKEDKPGFRIIGKPSEIEGKRGRGIRFDGEDDRVEIPNIGNFEMTSPFSFAFWVKPEDNEPYRSLLANAGHKNSSFRGYEIFLDSTNRIHARLTNALPLNGISIITEDPISAETWSHVAFTYDGSAKAKGTRLYLNGKEVRVRVKVDNLYKSILPLNSRSEVENRPIRLGRSYRDFDGDYGLFTGGMDEVYIFDRLLTSPEVYSIYKGEDENADQNYSKEDIAFHINYHSDEKVKGILTELKKEREEKLRFLSDKMEIMVMQESNPDRQTYILDRGTYDNSTVAVDADVPEKLNAMKSGWPKNRLGLAYWLTDPDNPLVARVAVNRYWSLFMGRGIVGTLNDFGNQGEMPTHPELLDWLALDFVQSGWDVKHLVKKIVMSATYRQSSLPRTDLVDLDPDNKWYARGPRHRLPGEFIRDSYLKASGLLVEKLGGPSVKPYQPEGLWEEKGEFSNVLKYYVRDTGENLYRKSLYTFIRRTSPPPSMVTFDASERSICMVQRQETNTPLQPLVLMNDPQIVEASKVMAEKILKDGGETTEERVAYAFSAIVGRMPKKAESDLFLKSFEADLDKFTKSPMDAEALLDVGDYQVDKRLSAAEAAAFTVLSNLIFNHFEFYTKL